MMQDENFCFSSFRNNTSSSLACKWSICHYHLWGVLSRVGHAVTGYKQHTLGEDSRHTLGRTNHVTGLVNSRPVSFLIYTLHTIFIYKWFEISHKKDGCQISMLLWKPNLPWWVSLQKQSTCSTSPCSLGPFPRRHLWSLSFYDEHFLQFSLVLHLPVKD